MPRKGPAQRRELMPDPIYRSLLVTQLVNKVMLHGKRSVAEKIVYDALKMVEEKSGAEPIATLKRAIDNIKPPLEVRSRRVGGATYQVPVEVRPRRASTLSVRWLVDFSRARREKTMADPANYLIAMKYLETLKEMTSGQGNKVVYIPYEATGILSSVGGIKDMLDANKSLAH